VGRGGSPPLAAAFQPIMEDHLEDPIITLRDYINHINLSKQIVSYIRFLYRKEKRIEIPYIPLLRN
jgi:hypothetical protein